MGVQKIDFFSIAKFLLRECGFSVAHDDVMSSHSSSYFASVFDVSGKGRIEFRIGRLTPKKHGHFVAFWKRSDGGSTIPFDTADNFDFFMICLSLDILEDVIDSRGYFFIPKKALVEHGVISADGVGGKRGFRLYAPWIVVNSAQARATQLWQKNYFFDLTVNR